MRPRPGLDDPLNSGLNKGQKFLILEIGTGFVVGEFPALLGTDRMNRAAAAEAIMEQKDTGTVFPGFEGITVGHEPLTHLTVTDAKIAGDPVDIRGHDIQAGLSGPIAAKPGTEVAENLVSAQAIVFAPSAAH